MGGKKRKPGEFGSLMNNYKGWRYQKNKKSLCLGTS